MITTDYDAVPKPQHDKSTVTRPRHKPDDHMTATTTTRRGPFPSSLYVCPCASPLMYFVVSYNSC
ncbi:hypothetical protein K443DRAFT_677436 [Laccaria amethystina LaAM-08-1]|uniref:Uncharacterized protein n=1 Tax=Laccaria amethystina LaAM-08-1 TaxID=1095629 RepID=A0A0C9WU69_9AGAR|nr:hypothetical protein K443DRAFT_677436 [Laccaria amethystina LaAM-08-1]